MESKSCLGLKEAVWTITEYYPVLLQRTSTRTKVVISCKTTTRTDQGGGRSPDAITSSTLASWPFGGFGPSLLARLWASQLSPGPLYPLGPWALTPLGLRVPGSCGLYRCRGLEAFLPLETLPTAQSRLSLFRCSLATHRSFTFFAVPVVFWLFWAPCLLFLSLSHSLTLTYKFVVASSCFLFALYSSSLMHDAPLCLGPCRNSTLHPSAPPTV